MLLLTTIEYFIDFYYNTKQSFLSQLNGPGSSCMCPGYFLRYFKPVTKVELLGNAVLPLNIVSVSENFAVFNCSTVLAILLFNLYLGENDGNRVVCVNSLAIPFCVTVRTGYPYQLAWNKNFSSPLKFSFNVHQDCVVQFLYVYQLL